MANSSAWIEFPRDLKETYGVGNLVPFVATFDGRVSYRGSLSKMGSRGAAILLRKDVRAELGKRPGDSVEVLIELDEEPREIDTPEDLQAALLGRGLGEMFAALAYTHRKEFVQWIEQAKRAETRQRRIEQACEMVHAGRRRS